MTSIMLPYFLLVAFIVFLQIESKNPINKKFFIVSLLSLFLFAALRGNGDGDYFSYLSFSTYITSFDDVLNFNFPMEIGFRIISYFVNVTGIHQQFVIMIMNAISIVCVGIFINKYSSNKMLSVFLFLPFYFQYDMHASRTAVAIGISLLGFGYIVDKKLLKFLIIVLLASAFHAVSLVLIPIYFLRYFKIDLKIGIISIALLTVITEIISVDKFIVTMFAGLGFDRMSARYSEYILSEDYGYAFSLLDPRLIIAVCIFIIANFRLIKPNKVESLLINITWLSAVTMILLREHTIFVTRLSAFFTIYMIVLIPIIMKRLIFEIELKARYVNLFNYKYIEVIQNYYLVKVFVVCFFSLYMGYLLYNYSVEYKIFF